MRDISLKMFMKTKKTSPATGCSLFGSDIVLQAWSVWNLSKLLIN